jgi:hypothetical protein
MAIYNDNIITINLNELSAVRAAFLEEELTKDEIDEVASELRTRMSFDSLYGQVDNMIWEITESTENLPQYGQIETGVIPPWRDIEQMKKNSAQFELVDLVAPSWTIKVPRRKK